MGEQRFRPGGGDEVGVRGREPAQGVGQFAGEAAGVGGQVEVDQHLLQAVAGDGAQHGQVRGGGAQGLVRSLALTVGVGVGVGCWEVDAAAQVVVGEGGHHDAVVRCPAVLDRLGQRILEDLFAVDLFVVHGVGEQVGRRAGGGGGAAAGAGGAGGLRQVGGGEDAGRRGRVEAAVGPDALVVVDGGPFLVRAAGDAVCLVHDSQVERRHRVGGVAGFLDLVE
ncbi:hypothetical protein [Streptomyces cyaneofuscatus]